MGDPVGEAAGKRRDPRQVLVAGGDHHGPGQEPPSSVSGRTCRRRAPAGPPGRPSRTGSRRRASPAAGRPRRRWRRRPRACSPSIVFIHPGVLSRKESQRWVAPGLTDPAPLQDHVLDPAVVQGGAGGQPGRSRAHHRTVDQHLAPPITAASSSDQVSARTPSPAPCPPPPRAALSGGWRALHQRSPSAAWSAARNAFGWSTADEMAGVLDHLQRPTVAGAGLLSDPPAASPGPPPPIRAWGPDAGELLGRDLARPELPEQPAVGLPARRVARTTPGSTPGKAPSARPSAPGARVGVDQHLPEHASRSVRSVGRRSGSWPAS